MTTELDPLIRDLLAWCSREPRTYTETIEAWRTSCPRLTVWEDAMDRGFLARQPSRNGGVAIVVTARGRAFLETRSADAV